MNHMSIVEALQWQAQLAIDRGVPVIYNARATTRAEAQELEAILNG